MVMVAPAGNSAFVDALKESNQRRGRSCAYAIGVIPAETRFRVSLVYIPPKDDGRYLRTEEYFKDLGPDEIEAKVNALESTARARGFIADEDQLDVFLYSGIGEQDPCWTLVARSDMKPTVLDGRELVVRRGVLV